jgi:hypothetical protein
MHSWFFWTILAMVTFGAWGFFPKLAVNYINPQSALIFQVIGGLLVGFVGLALPSTPLLPLCWLLFFCMRPLFLNRCLVSALPLRPLFCLQANSVSGKIIKKNSSQTGKMSLHCTLLLIPFKKV